MSVIRARFRAVSGERSRSLPLIQLRRFRGARGALPLCHGSQRRRRKWGGSTSRWPGQRSLHSPRQRYALGAVGCQKTRGGGAPRAFSSPPRPSSWFRFARRAASPFSVAVSRAGGPALDVRFETVSTSPVGQRETGGVWHDVRPSTHLRCAFRPPAAGGLRERRRRRA